MDEPLSAFEIMMRPDSEDLEMSVMSKQPVRLLILNSSASLTLNETIFLQDETLKRAYSRGIEVIGEAVKQLPDDLCRKYPEINWRSLARMPDKLIHYCGLLRC